MAKVKNNQFCWLVGLFIQVELSFELLTLIFLVMQSTGMAQRRFWDPFIYPLILQSCHLNQLVLHMTQQQIKLIISQNVFLLDIQSAYSILFTKYPYLNMFLDAYQVLKKTLENDL